jgi:hypothetical protein
MPERLDAWHFREKAMTTNIEAPSISLDRARDTTNNIVGLQHHTLLAITLQLIRCCKPCWAGANHDNLRRKQLLGTHLWIRKVL